jgi:hypothetical protein
MDRKCAPGHPRGILFDHHRWGDPGFRVAPKHYLRASAVGQLIRALAQAGVDFPEWDELKLRRDRARTPGIQCDREAQVALIAGKHSQFVRDGEYITDCGNWPRYREFKNVKRIRRIPQQILMVAAADHCRLAALRGECPGVDPDTLA